MLGGLGTGSFGVGVKKPQHVRLLAGIRDLSGGCPPLPTPGQDDSRALVLILEADLILHSVSGTSKEATGRAYSQDPSNSVPPRAQSRECGHGEPGKIRLSRKESVEASRVSDTREKAEASFAQAVDTMSNLR